MLFNSFTFLIFFIITFFLYYIPILRKFQLLILVISSFVFYAWNSPELLILLIGSVVINSIISFWIVRLKYNRLLFLTVLGVVLNILLLISFKYSGLLYTSAIQLGNFAGLSFQDSTFKGLPLPIGISFYTFEGISLLVDTMRRKVKTGTVEFIEQKFSQHLLKTCLFITFFPHLIAGPILKADHFYPQIKSKSLRNINWQIVFQSLVFGFFLKMVVADNLKDYTFWLTPPYYKALSTVTGLTLVFGYSMQIFADFAGYSLIAIGLGAALGYQLPQNFNLPYISRSISEFWRRWHISLSTWLKDYLYIPLGGNRLGQTRTYMNLMIVMLLGGLWHGASWNYAVWGGFHGLALGVDRFIRDKMEMVNSISLQIWIKVLRETISIVSVFSFVSLGWLLFKLKDFTSFLDFMDSMSKNSSIDMDVSKVIPVLFFSLPIILYHLIHLPMLEYIQISRKINLLFHVHQDTLKSVLFGIMLFMILLNSGSENEFIYFQF